MNEDVIRLADVRAIPDMSITEAGPSITEAGPNGDGPTEPDSWTPINLALLPDQPPAQPTLGGVGLVYPGERHVFSGPPESAKTLAAYAIALEVIRAGGTVAVIDFEMGRWQARDRLRDLGATTDELERIHYIDPADPATTDRIAPLVALQPQLVIIDAAAGAYDNLGLDDNKRGDVERFTRIYVRDFWRAGIATIVLDHVTKNAETRGRFVIGSERKLGGSQVHLGFETINPISRGTSGLYKIITHKDRGGYLQRGRVADLHLDSDPATHRITWRFEAAEHNDEDEPFRPTVLMERISQYLEGQPEPVSRTNIETNVKGKSAEWLRKAIDALIHDGYAAEEEGPRNARLVRTIRPFTATPSDPVSPRLDGVISPRLTPSPPTGDGRRGDVVETDSPRLDEIDVHDPAVQALLDDIPF